VVQGRRPGSGSLRDEPQEAGGLFIVKQLHL